MSAIPNNASTIDQVKVLLRDLNELTARKHYTISLLQPMVYYIVQPWLKGFNGQAGGILGMGGAGSPQLYFWAPRYWIDSKLKKSLGG